MSPIRVTTTTTAALAAAILFASALSPAIADAAITPRQSGINRAHHNHHLAHHRETLAGDPYRDIGRIPRPCDAGCWWHRAVLWGRVATAEGARLDRLRHPSAAACYRLVARRFAGTGMARAAHDTVTRESGCRWYAQNPTSTAAGAWQFLDTWGSLADRRDVVWSTARALRAFRSQGGACPAWC